MKLRVARLLSVIVLCAVMALEGCMPTTPPSLSRHENIIPPTRTLVNSDGQTVEHNWLELPDISGKSESQKFVTHYTTIGGKRVRNYSMLFDTEHRVALWVAYPLHQCYLGTTARTNAWDWDPKFSESVQPQVAYGSFGNPYQRGHQIPSADRLVSYEANAQTFYVTNSVPQIQDGFNGGIWNSLEGALQSIAASEKIYIVTGPVYGENRYGSIGESRVMVPDAFFKAVMVRDGNRWQSIAFVMQNRAYNDNMQNCAMSVDELEDLTGFDFFAALDDAEEAGTEKSYKLSFWKL